VKSAKVVNSRNCAERFRIDLESGMLSMTVKNDKSNDLASVFEHCHGEDLWVLVESHESMQQMCRVKIELENFKNYGLPQFDRQKYESKMSSTDKFIIRAFGSGKKYSDLMYPISYKLQLDKNIKNRAPEYFKIDENTGMITIPKITPKRSYNFYVRASYKNDLTKYSISKVQIQVVTSTKIIKKTRNF
jgi:hypothetical protein